MYQPEINRTFTEEQIADFVINNDKGNIFASEKLNRDEFVKAVRRLDLLKFIVVFKDGDDLQGVLGYHFLSESNKHEASKASWRLPENIIDGDILYLSFIATKGNCDVLAIKKMFEEMGYRDRINKRRGYTNGNWYEHRIYKKEKNIKGDRNAQSD